MSHTTEDYKELLMTTAERGAADYLQRGKLGGEFVAAVDRLVDNEGIYKLVALLITYAPTGDARLVWEEMGFTDQHVARELERLEDIQFEQNRQFKKEA